MIKDVILTGDMVMVFDEQGEQIPEYQGPYWAVKEKILKNAPLNTAFAHGLDDNGNPKRVPREKW